MPKSNSPAKRQSSYTGKPRAHAGFSLLEVQIAIAIAALISVAAIPSQIRSVQGQIQDLVARQMFTVGEAAQAFRQQQGSWPGDDALAVTPCADALNNSNPESILFLTDYYVGNINTGFGGATLAVRCPTPNRFEVSVNAPTAAQAQLLASKLHTATIAGTVVTSTFPLPSAVPALNGVLHRVVIPGRPELNRMEANIDVNGNQLNNTARISGPAGLPLNVDSNVNMNGNNITTANTIFTRTASVGTGGITNGGTLTNTGNIRANGGLDWGSSRLDIVGPTGNIELGGTNTTAGTGTPSIDFHFTGLTEDANTRIINDLNGVLTVQASRVVANNDLQVNRNALVGGTLQARQFVDQASGRRLESYLSDAGIIEVDPFNDTLVPKPTCGAGLTPRIHVTPASYAQGTDAKPVAQVRTFAVDKGASWDLEMFVLTEDGQQRPAPGFGFVQVILQCGAA